MDTQGKYYDNACETVHCIMNINKFISFKKMNHLMSWFSYDINDTFDVNQRIMKNQSKYGTS